MAEGGIHAGDPLIEKLTDTLDSFDMKYKVTKSSGAKKGDGDVYTKQYELDIAFDGKYVIDPPVNPKFLAKDLEKIKIQAASIGRLGVILTNTKNEDYVALTLNDFLAILSTAKEK